MPSACLADCMQPKLPSNFRQRLWQRLQEAGIPDVPADCLVNAVPGRASVWVSATDVVTVAGIPLPPMQPRCYFAYHKPVGVDCNVRAGQPDSISQLLQQLPAGVFPVGRLDKDSCGLLLLTNDGTLASRLLHPSFAHQKTYQVSVDKTLSAAALTALQNGLLYQAGPTSIQARPCQVQLLPADAQARQLQLTLTEGKNRQIRYMLKTLGYRVVALKRIAIGRYQLADLPANHIRQLTSDDLLLLDAHTTQPNT